LRLGPVGRLRQAQDFALLDGSFSKALPGLASQKPAADILRRAKAGLDRTPAPLPVVHTEGTLPGKGIREISTKAREDLPTMFNLALAYRMTGDKRYLDLDRAVPRSLGRRLQDLAQPDRRDPFRTGHDGLRPDLSGPVAGGADQGRGVLARHGRGLPRRHGQARATRPSPTGRAIASSWRPWRRSRPATRP
jgi:hypothetical protein